MEGKRFLSIAVMALAISLLASACVTPTTGEVVEREVIVTKEVPVEVTKVVQEIVTPDEVKVGFVYPLSGPAGEYGYKSLIAVELAADIINYKHPELGDFPFAATSGLPNLGGATFHPIFADHQGKAELGTTELERLITEEGVVATAGCWYSSVTIAARTVSERYGIPMINDVSSNTALNLDRANLGLEWYFSITGDDFDVSAAFFDVLDDLKVKGQDIKTIALLHRDDSYGMGAATNQLQLIEERGYELVADVAFPAETADLSAEVIRLKAAEPDVVIAWIYPEEWVTYVRTSKELNFNPGVLQGGSGCSSPLVLEEAGADMDHILCREGFALSLAETLDKPEIGILNDMFRVRSKGVDFDADAVRSFQIAFVISSLINNAGSTDPEAIRQAALELDMPSEQLIMPYECIKFDPVTGKNVCARWVLVQAKDQQYSLVWPWNIAATDLVYPWPKWDER